MSEDHQSKHQRQGRFNVHSIVGQIGVACGKDCAAASAKGQLQGAAEELVTLIGEREAYEFVTSIADGIVAKLAKNPNSFENSSKESKS